VIEVLQKYRILCIVTLAFVGGASYELSYVESTSDFVAGIAAPNPAADVLLELYPQRLSSKCLEADRALYLKYDLQTAKQNLEEALTNNFKDDPSYFYNYATILMLLGEPAEVVDEAVRQWRRNGIPVQDEYDPRIIYKGVTFPLPLEEGATQLLTKSLDGRRIAMAPEMAVETPAKFARVNHLFATTSANRTSDVAAPSRFTALNLSHDGSHLISANEGGAITIIDLDKQEFLYRLKNATGDVFAAATIPSLNLALTGDRSGNLNLWNLESGQMTAVIQAADRTLSSIAVSTDNSMLATGDWDGNIKVWKISSAEGASNVHLHKTVTAAHQGVITNLVFGPNDQTLASASRDHTATIWKIGTEISKSTTVRHLAPVYGLDISPDGQLLATSSVDQKIKVWTVETGEQRNQFVVHRTLEGKQISIPVYSVLFSVDSKEVITVSDQQELTRFRYQ
tara:strand:+ start:8352 stop:9713 length:1362 start_codon:yes stop_codon:yes gene_type:complete